MDDARTSLPPGNAFRYLAPDIAPLPAGLHQRVPLRTAAEIETERLATKRR